MIFAEQMADHYRRTDRVFRWLLLLQWAAAIGIALVLSPFAWRGKIATVHHHVLVAIFVGALINSLPLVLVAVAPGRVVTRHVIAVAQMLWSALLIHLTGGRIESHFHIFGSLAFLAFYTDWRLLVTATAMVITDHAIRGSIWPESIYGAINPEWWRFFEHGVWVAFEDAVLIFGCFRSLAEKRQIAAQQQALYELNANIETEVERKTRQLGESLERLRDVIASTDAHPWEIDLDTMCFTVVDKSETPIVDNLVVGGSAAYLLELIHPDDRQKLVDALGNSTSHPNAPPLTVDYRIIPDPARPPRYLRSSLALRHSSDGKKVLRGLSMDVTEARKLEIDLQHAQKLESVGRLAAGVAHEINTPVQFISDNLHFLRDANTEILRLVALYRQACHEAQWGIDPKIIADNMRRAEQEADLDFLTSHLGRAIDGSLEGIKRVSTITRSMKEFAHPDQREMTSVNLNRALESTLAIAVNEYKYVADVQTDFGDIPPVTCFAGELNQVFLNLLVNAAHAIEAVVAKTENRGVIRVASRRKGSDVVISIGDTGGGIPVEVRDKIFDPFFTTKEVGRGTGQGLAIARSVVVDKHGGEIRFESEVGVGTTFHLRLPIEGVDAARQRKVA